MRMKHKFILLVVVGILLIAGVGSALDFYACVCSCTLPTGTIDITATSIDEDSCMEACGAICGGYTNCTENCNTCCDEDNGYCSKVSIPAVTSWDINKVKDGCEKSCKSTCKLHETIHGITGIIYYIAGIIAAIMFVISGYKFITSDNPEDRTEAKKGFMFVILALIIIIIAESLVNLLMAPAQPESVRGVVLYQDDNFGKNGEFVSEGKSDLTSSRIAWDVGGHGKCVPFVVWSWDGSIIIIDDCEATLYENADCTGDSHRLTSTTNNIVTAIGGGPFYAKCIQVTCP